MSVSLDSVKKELSRTMKKPWRLPRGLFISAICMFFYFVIAVYLHIFHKGLPYATTEIFVWTLASFNASQLGSDSEGALNHTKKKRSLKDLFITKNIVLLIFAIPLDFTLVTLACWLIGDWSSFWVAQILAIAAVIISLGLGNIVSVLWVYRPISPWKIRHDRTKIAEYLIFVALSYVAASIAVPLALIPGSLLYNNLNTHSAISVTLGILILLAWALICWTLSLRYAQHLADRHSKHFIGRLEGEPLKVKNPRLKKLLKTT
jgi:ABC-type multidrug transport system fused ATPase/permease subunit